jgi:hypothetical protein
MVFSLTSGKSFRASILETADTAHNIIRLQVENRFRSAVIARQREMRYVSMDMLDSSTILDGCMITKNERT